MPINSMTNHAVQNTNQEGNASMNNNNESEFSTKSMENQMNTGLAALDEIAGGRVKVTELFVDRTDGGSQVLKPKNMSVEQLALHATQHVKANAEPVNFTKRFKARPNDGAVAFANVLTGLFGMGAIGKTTSSFFGGTQRPEYKSVTVGFNEDGTSKSIEVPWGLMEFSPLQAQFNLYYDVDIDYGFCFVVEVTAPKKNRERIQALFTAVEEYLKRNSIYKNACLKGVGRATRDGQIVEPEFVRLITDTSKIVYNADVERDLTNSTWGVFEKAQTLRENDIPLGEKVLLVGPNGSGKTMGAYIAAQRAIENGWTVVFARFDEDLSKVVAFAEKVGTPCLVIVEDVEKLMVPADQDRQEMDKMLDLFDGAGSKNREVMLLMTTNHVHEMKKSMLRAGRVDRIIDIESLNREAFEKLFRVMVGDHRLEGVDFDVLYEAMPDAAPVWIVAAIRRAEKAVIIRTGVPKGKFVTDDFLTEISGLRRHFELHTNAKDREPVEALGHQFSQIVAEQVRREIDESQMNTQNYRFEKVASN